MNKKTLIAKVRNLLLATSPEEFMRYHDKKHTDD